MAQSAQRYPHLRPPLPKLEWRGIAKTLLVGPASVAVKPERSHPTFPRSTPSSIESLMKRRVRHTLAPGAVRIGVLARDQTSERRQSKGPFKRLPFHKDA